MACWPDGRITILSDEVNNNNASNEMSNLSGDLYTWPFRHYGKPLRLASFYFFFEIGNRYLIFNDLVEFMQIILNHFKSLFIKLILFVMNLGTN